MADRAKNEASRSQAIADYLQEILASVDPEEAARSDLDVESIVVRARDLFGNDHATVAASLSSLALQRQQSGDLTAAEPLYRESIRIWCAIYGNRHANVGITLGRLGSLLRAKGDDAAAEHAFREALDIYAELPDKASLASTDARLELAEILKRRDKLDEAEALVREVLRIRRSVPKHQEFQIATSLEQLFEILSMAGKDQQAEEVDAQGLNEQISHISGLNLWQRVAMLRAGRGSGKRASDQGRPAGLLFRTRTPPPKPLNPPLRAGDAHVVLSALLEAISFLRSSNSGRYSHLLGAYVCVPEKPDQFVLGGAITGQRAARGISGRELAGRWRLCRAS
jgi:tetratricopeptide (TPR) repeat protein